MSTTYYRIVAWSPSLNERLQEVDLSGPPTTNQQYAEQLACAYAGRLNRDQKLRVTDWVGEAVANVVDD